MSRRWLSHGVRPPFEVSVKGGMAHPGRLFCRSLGLVGAVAASISMLHAGFVGVAPARADFGFVPGGQAATFSTSQAGAHPDFTVAFALNTHPGLTEFGEFVDRLPDGELKDLITVLPPGLVGNPQALARCDQARLIAATCPRDTTLGQVLVQLSAKSTDLQAITTRVYDLPPQPGEAAALGFNVLGAIIVRIGAAVGPGGGYRVTSLTRNVTNPPGQQPIGVVLTLWGVPADHSGPGPLKDATSAQINPLEQNFGDANAAQSRLAFMSAATSCGADPLVTILSGDSWQDPGAFVTTRATSPATVGCDLLSFKPSISVTPGTGAADSPSGLSVDLHLPQTDDPALLATPTLRKAVVTLPGGLAVNPSSANGLDACSPIQIGLHDDNEPHCPEASNIGTVEIDTPLLGEPVEGSLYVATPHDNPFRSLLAIYIVAEADGVLVKLAGKVDSDPVSGQLTTTFDENPQLPFEDLKVRLFGGPRASVLTPPTCGAFTTTTELTPWSAPDSGPLVAPSSAFTIGSGPNGSPCANSAAEEPHNPSFEAGTFIAIAGSYSPFVLHLRREDGSQRLRALDVILPPGLTGRLAGIPYCSEQALTVAAMRRGRYEAARPDCPAASQVGMVDVGAGAGAEPFHVQGATYLAGPYKGAPLSLAIITPAVAGPFDLGTVVVRTALYVNPETAQIHAVSDPIPTILEGIPLDVRSITLKMVRPNFTLNPTNCEELGFTGSALSVLGQVAPLSQHFQVGACRALDFEPNLSTRLFGKTNRGAHPRFRAVLTMPKSDQANIARAAVILPHSEFLDQSHIRTVCTRVQFASGGGNGEGCPAGSIYGRARAWSPLLDEPLSGPVYLRSSAHKLPDLVVALNGQIQIALAGRIDSIHGGIRTTFETVPDAPISKFVLSMQGGKKGLLVNSRDLCSRPLRVTALFDGQNGKTHDFKPLLQNSCGKSTKHHKAHHRAGR